MKAWPFAIMLALVCVLCPTMSAATAASSGDPFTPTAQAAAAPGDTCHAWTPMSDANDGYVIDQNVGGMLSAFVNSKGEEDTLVLCRQLSSGLYYMWSPRWQRYVSAEIGYTGGSYGELRARSTTVSRWELFSFGHDPRNGAVTIRANANGRYVSTEINYSGDTAEMLRARATVAGDWEDFGISEQTANGDECWPFLMETSSGPFSLSGPSNIVSAELHDGGLLRARASTQRQWERFRICHSEGTPYYYIQSLANGRYVSAEVGTKGSDYAMLRARATVVSRWERFTVSLQGYFPLLFLRSAANGRYVSAEFSYPGSRTGELRAAATTRGRYGGFQAFFIPPPMPVTNLHATATSSSITLNWTNPASPKLQRIAIISETGPYAIEEPVAFPSGTVMMPDQPPAATSVVDTQLSTGITEYTYTVWAVDNLEQFSAPTSVTVDVPS